MWVRFPYCNRNPNLLLGVLALNGTSNTSPQKSLATSLRPAPRSIGPPWTRRAPCLDELYRELRKWIRIKKAVIVGA